LKKKLAAKKKKKKFGYNYFFEFLVRKLKKIAVFLNILHFFGKKSKKWGNLGGFLKINLRGI